MVNRCKFLNMALTLCGVSNSSCRYMADPHSCPNYDEEFNKPMPPSHPDWVDRLGTSDAFEVKALTSFVTRTDAELKEMSIKMDESEKPDRPCGVCKADEWWQRDSGEWVCGRCHPKPIEKEVPDWF